MGKELSIPSLYEYQLQKRLLSDARKSMSDVIAGLKILAGIAVSVEFPSAIDVNNNGKIGMEDIICLLSKLSNSNQ